MRTPRTKSSGPAFRQARMEGRPEPGCTETCSPTYGSAQGVGTGSGPAASATRQGGATGPSYGKASGGKGTGPKFGPGPGGIGRSGRGAPIT